MSYEYIVNKKYKIVKCIKLLFILCSVIWVCSCNNIKSNNIDVSNDKTNITSISNEINEYVYKEIDFDELRDEYILKDDTEESYINYFKKCNHNYILNRENIEYTDKEKKIIYLTFDDGPVYKHTEDILDILEANNIKATFFIGNVGYKGITKRIYNEGHSLALHTATHEYSYIYSNLKNYLQDLYRVQKFVKEITGIYTHFYRFPGGSVTDPIPFPKKALLLNTIKPLLYEMGFQYFDWNVSAGDSGSVASSEQVKNNVINALKQNKNKFIVLMHGIHDNTVIALQDIINYGKEHNYAFEKITDETKPIHFTKELTMDTED